MLRFALLILLHVSVSRKYANATILTMSIQPYGYKMCTELCKRKSLCISKSFNKEHLVCNLRFERIIPVETSDKANDPHPTSLQSEFFMVMPQLYLMDRSLKQYKVSAKGYHYFLQDFSYDDGMFYVCENGWLKVGVYGQLKVHFRKRHEFKDLGPERIEQVLTDRRNNMLALVNGEMNLIHIYQFAGNRLRRIKAIKKQVRFDIVQLVKTKRILFLQHRTKVFAVSYRGVLLKTYQLRRHAHVILMEFRGEILHCYMCLKNSLMESQLTSSKSKRISLKTTKLKNLHLHCTRNLPYQDYLIANKNELIITQRRVGGLVVFDWKGPRRHFKNQSLDYIIRKS